MRLKKIKKHIPFYVMGIPGLLYLFINNYMPVYGLQIAFKDFNYTKGIWGSDFIGLDNFKFLFANDAFVITRNTIGYNLVWLLLNTVLGIIVAIFLNEIRGKVSKKVYQTFILLPYLISMVVASYLVYAFLSEETGMINSLLQSLNLKSVQWYMEAKYWPFILTIVYEWRMLGFNVVIYLATIVGFDKACYEAAELDGASKLQQIRSITLPMLKPTILMLVTLGMGNIFRSDFGLFYQVPKNQGML